MLGSIFTGWATPTEAAGVGALFSLILAIFYKQFSWKMLYDSLIDTAKTSAMVFIILFGASAFTGIFMSLDGDQLIATWISSVGIGKWGAFAIMMAIVFFMGMFLDWLGIVMIVFPIFLPIMDMFGFDRLCSLFGGSDSIRDYIAFPKNNAGRDVMLDAPGCIDQAQLDELHIQLVKPEE